MNRKLLAALCAVTAAATLFGCSNGGNVSSTPSSSAPAGSSSTAESSGVSEAAYPIVKDKLTVTGIIIDDGAAIDLSKPRQVWEKVEEITNIHVDWETISMDSAATYYASNDYADIITQKWEIPGEILSDYGVLGQRFVNFNDYLNCMPNLVKTFEDYPAARKISTETDGGIYQLPYIGNDCTATTARMYYRQDTLKAAGCEVPATTEEFYEVLKKLKDFNDGAAPLTEISLNFLWSSFGPGKNPDFEDDGTGKVIYNRNSDQYKYYLQYMARLYSEGLLHREYLTLDGATMGALAQEAKTVFGNVGWTGLSEKDFQSGKVEITQLTPLTSEYDSERSVIGYNYASPRGVALNAKSQHIPELCRMLDISYATEEVVKDSGLYGISFCYGMENVNWKWANDSHTEYELLLPEGMEGTTFSAYQYSDLIYYNIGRFDTFKDATTATEGNSKARQQGFVENLIPYQEEVAFPGSYLKFTDDEQNVLNNKWTSISEYVNQSMAEFITGIRSVDSDWNAYVSQISAMGIDDVLAVYQSAYDRFNQ